MKIYLEEKIGNPDLFTGRTQELADLLEWIDRIKPRLSKSTAILSRRKTGTKTPRRIPSKKFARVCMYVIADSTNTVQFFFVQRPQLQTCQSLSHLQEILWPAHTYIYRRVR